MEGRILFIIRQMLRLKNSHLQVPHSIGKKVFLLRGTREFLNYTSEFKKIMR